MVDFQARPYDDEATWQRGLSTLPTTAGQVFGATFDETWQGNITPLAYRAIDRRQTNAPELWEPEVDALGNVTGQGRWVTNEGYVPSPMLEPDEANKRFGITYNGQRALHWDQTVSEREAEELHRLKVEELQRKSVVSRGPQGLWMDTGKFAVGLGASIVDPINLLSAFIPVVGSARYAMLLANAGTSLLARAGVRAGVGAIEGAVGQALLEPGVYALSRAEKRDYEMVDSLQNILFGGVFGGGLHILGGGAKDAYRGISKIIDDAPIETKRAMIGEAITALAEGRPVRADLALREYLLGGTGKLTPYEMARAEFDLATRSFTDQTVRPFAPDAPARPIVPESEARPQRVGIDMGGNVRARPDAPHPMPDRNGSFVPMVARNDELMQFTTRKRAENAMKRIERDEGVRPEIVETPNGFILRTESKMEPVRMTDGTPMLFPNERQAQRWAEQQVIKNGPDIDPVTGTGRQFDVIPFSDGGPVRYALVEGATPKELVAARRAPDQVEFAKSRDVETIIRDNAKTIVDARADFERAVKQYLKDKLDPPVRQTEAEVRMQADINADHIKASGIRAAIERDGGVTELNLIERELKELDDQIKAVDSVGELPEGSRALLDEANGLIKQAEDRASMFERIAGCLRGSI